LGQQRHHDNRRITPDLSKAGDRFASGQGWIRPPLLLASFSRHIGLVNWLQRHSCRAAGMACRPRPKGGGTMPQFPFVRVVVLCLCLCWTNAAAADVVVDWNAIAARTVLAGQSPFSQARLMAIVQLAVFEAVNAVTGDYEPYLTVPISAGLEMMRRFVRRGGPRHHVGE
jgi:hypothetical protein